MIEVLEYDEEFLMDAGVPEAERAVLLAAVAKLKSGGGESLFAASLPLSQFVRRCFLMFL